jgi:hypothetical protein
MIHPKAENPIMILFEAMIGGNPSDAIVASEKRGQNNLVNSDVLPKRCDRAKLEGMGVVFGEDFDDLFVHVTLPDGWQKVATTHDMWSKLLNADGEEIAMIFYKAAFYDRDAFATMTKK